MSERKEKEAAKGPRPDATFKVVLCGDSSVGKTNLMGRYTRNEFMDDSKSTIGAEFASRTVEYRNMGKKLNIKVQIWDTAGQERYRAVTRTYYRDAVGAILVYNTTAKKTFKHLDRWYDDVAANASENVVCVLAGNKIDLVHADAAKRKVMQETAVDFGKLKGVPIFHEVSAKTGEGVDEMFSNLVKAIVKANPDIFKGVAKDQERVKLDAKAKGGDGADGGGGAEGGKKKGGCC